MRVLLNTDVVFGVIMARGPFSKAAAELLDLNEQGLFAAYISGITPVNIFYIARKAKSSADLRQVISRLLQTVRVCSLDHSVLTAAFNLPFNYYGDAVQHACATAGQLDAIVTRNPDDYKNAPLPVFAPADFLNHIKARRS